MLKLTDEQRVRYLTVFMGDRCPHCESADHLGTLSDLQLTATWEASLGIYCSKCGARWRDIYRLHDVEDIEEPSSDEIEAAIEEEEAAYRDEEEDDADES